MPRGAPPISLEALLPFYAGAFFTTVALKGRLGAIGAEGRAALQEVSHLQKMVIEYREAIQKTIEMKRPGGA
ncbi:MAG: hypothetical protein HY329_24720 [Chloroflexi bacterium]|nr:hypothetical protein [Chloroflexota bacterium]